MKLDHSEPWSLLTRDQRERLVQYEHLVEQHAPALGLVGPADLGRVHERHVLDSLRVLHCIRPREERSLVDMGSGAGFPGIPVAVALPEAAIALVEPKRRRVAFLELVVEELGLRNTEVVAAPMVEFGDRRHDVDACLARAFGSPAIAWAESARVLRRGGRVLYYAGRSWSEASSDLPAGVRARICAPSRGPDSGPIVALFETDPSQEHPDGPDALT